MSIISQIVTYFACPAVPVSTVHRTSIHLNQGSCQIASFRKFASWLWRALPWAATVNSLSHLRRSHHSLITNYPSLLYNLSCPIHPPHQHRSPTLCLFSTLHWNLTNERLRRTWHRIRSFPPFNHAIPPRQSSPSFENKSPHPANPKMLTTNSQNGSPRW